MTPGPKRDYRETITQLDTPQPFPQIRPAGREYDINDGSPATTMTTRDYNEPHYPDEKNILWHQRSSQRPMYPDNAARYHMEETQSQWHQRGRKEGYLPEPYKANHLRRVPQMDGENISTDPATGRREYVFEDTRSDAGLYDNGEQRYDRYSGFGDTEEEGLQDVLQFLNQSGSRGHRAVPPAPYKNNIDRMMIQRAMAEAVEAGSTGMTWPLGREQRRRAGGVASDSDTGEFLTQKYDVNYPNVVNKIARAYGGPSQQDANFSRMNTELFAPDTDDFSTLDTQGPRRVVSEPTDHPIAEVFRGEYPESLHETEEMARKVARDRNRDLAKNETTRVHNIDFSPELTAAIKKGIPLSIFTSMIGPELIYGSED